MGFLP